ncbi:type 2 periplasmic-binding domain-containing protein [Legionella tunisiensis]|uniref:transporter substrate-binding domain-containing protein n=1 Tax=Legionella tunisiensis TaxID=1034944 RepID=UPI0002FA3F3D|nr:transporter substrate-binding domain-containing protein [Legionella tunisiensis]
METLIDSLSKGLINAAFVDNNEARYWETYGSGLFHYIGKPMKVADGVGIMALPQNFVLIQQINQVLLQIEDDNEYLNLYTTYFGMNP